MWISRERAYRDHKLSRECATRLVHRASSAISAIQPDNDAVRLQKDFREVHVSSSTRDAYLPKVISTKQRIFVQENRFLEILKNSVHRSVTDHEMIETVDKIGNKFRKWKNSFFQIEGRTFKNLLDQDLRVSNWKSPRRMSFQEGLASSLKSPRKKSFQEGLASSLKSPRRTSFQEGLASSLKSPRKTSFQEGLASSLKSPRRTSFQEGLASSLKSPRKTSFQEGLASSLKSPRRTSFQEGLASSLFRLCILLVLLINFVMGVELNSKDNRTFAVDSLKDGSTWYRASHWDAVEVEHLPKNKFSNKLRHFNEWSEWSACDRHCTQNRFKRCRTWKKCGNIVLREERSCYHKRKGRRRRCSQQRRRVNENNYQFHVVQWPNETEPRYGGRRIKKGSRNRLVTHYGKWSKWSPCTRSCTTQRHRWCRKPGSCGRDVIRESAYCYVEGSFCQKWIHRRIRGSNEDENDDTVLDKFELNLDNVESFGTTQKEETWRCGVSGNAKNLRLSYMTRIIGGRPAAPGSWPWQVAVLNRFREAFCGGTLVSPRWILTAAHCIRKRLYVRIGEHDLTIKEGTELEFRVDLVAVHPQYDADTVDNDVALLRLPVTLSPSISRGIACLPAPRQILPTNQLCTIIGWGKTRATDDFGTDVLHEAKIPIVSGETCRGVYEDYRITDNMFCAGYRRGRMDSCAGDSGGPLLCKDPNRPDHPWTIFGITSFGEGCGKRGKFGIYARLANYIRWIAKIMRESDTTS